MQGKKRILFLPWWAWVPIGCLVLGICVVFGVFAFLRGQFEAAANSYDLGDIEKMESATLIFDREGNQFGKIFILNRNPIDYDQIPKVMVEAVVAAEDNRFWEHGGVDYWGIARAALKNYLSGGIKQGASTITQQLARNSVGLTARTYQRKFIEILLAERIEKNFSKEKIMELYLNRVYFGSGLYGVEAAARGYFGVPAKDLTAGQAAMLAGLLKSPNGLSPWNNIEGARNARNFVLGRMQELGFLTSEETRREQQSVLVVRRRMNPFKVSYAVDYVRQQAISALGYEKAMNGGFRIYTTIDPEMQRVAEMSLRRELAEAEARPGYSHETFEDFERKFAPHQAKLRAGGFADEAPLPTYLQGAVIAYHNATGGILALVGGRDFRHSEYNRATQARRPAGTAFAPLVFAAAFDNGMFPGELVQDAALDNRYVNIGGLTGILGEWGVERVENEYEGTIPAREALVQSKNAATVRVGWEAGLPAVTELAVRAGIASPIRQFSNAFLGTSVVTLEELTLAFTSFPGRGTRPTKPFIIEKIVDRDGRIIYQPNAKRVLVMKESTAFQVHKALEESLVDGTAAAARSQFGLGDFVAGGKSGTAYNFTDTYFVGYTSEVTCGVWVGFDKPTQIYRGAFGNELALPVWVDVMNASIAHFAPQEFPRPESVVPVSICRTSGLLETGRCFEEVTDPVTGVTRQEKTAYIEFSTDEQKPHVPCDVHGTGVKLYADKLEASEWPRAAAVVDLGSVRPVAISEPALVGLHDVYRSVKPAALRLREDEIPIAKALPVDQQVAEAAKADGAAAVAAASAAPEGSQEVRKAETAKPLDVPLGAATIAVEPPKPIEF